jgi:hypothetical protein
VLEILAFGQDGFAHCLRERVGETVPEIQLGGMPAALAKIFVGLARYPSLLCGNCLESERGFAKEIVELPALGEECLRLPAYPQSSKQAPLVVQNVSMIRRTEWLSKVGRAFPPDLQQPFRQPCSL